MLIYMHNFLILLISIFFSSCFANETTKDESIINLDANSFNDHYNKHGGILLDVRTSNETDQGIIMNASVIDFYDQYFYDKISKIQKDKIVYVYCRSGGRSSRAAELLVKSGQIQVVNLMGGIKDWQNSGYDIVKNNNSKNLNIDILNQDDFNKILIHNDLVLVDFHTQWCVPCRKMIPIINEIQNEYAEHVYILKIDVDHNKLLENIYNITTVPTIVLFKEGKEILRRSGFLSSDEIKKIIKNQI